MRKRILSTLLAVIATINFVGGFSTSTAKAYGGAEPVASEKTFDLSLFEQNIRKALDGKAIGYAYAINLNGQLKKSGANGYAVLKRDVPNNVQLQDPKGIAQSATKRMNIASITKTITAVTVLKILQDGLAPNEQGLTVESKVAKFLPASWVPKANINEIAQQSNGVSQLTFRELLSQFSGMNNNVGGNTSIASLHKWIAAGVTRPKSEYKYINANLGIFRVIIPMMMMQPADRKKFSDLAATDEKSFDQQVSALYKKHVNDLVLKPMGIQNADCANPDPLQTRLYAFPDAGFPSTLTGDWTLSAGGGGWYLSAVELARFLAHVRYNDAILTPATRRLMDAGMLGWRAGSSPTGDYGLYRAHGGGLGYSPALPKPNEGSLDDIKIPVQSNGMTGCIMNFPNGAQVSLLINSSGPFGDKYTLLKEAFDNAWVLGKVLKP